MARWPHGMDAGRLSRYGQTRMAPEIRETGMIDYLQHMWQLARDGQSQGVCFFIVLYVSALSLWTLLRLWRIRRWPVVRAQLLSLGREAFGHDAIRSEQQYTASALYRYEVDGREYQGSEISAAVKILASGAAARLPDQLLRQVNAGDDGTVEIRYNPARPQHSYLLRPGRIALLLYALGAFGLPLWYWYAWYLPWDPLQVIYNQWLLLKWRMGYY